MTLFNPVDCSPPGSSVHGDFPDKNTGVDCHAFLLTQGLNPGFPHCKQILYHLSHQGSPKMLEWVAYPFCRGSSQSRDRTRFSCIAGRFFTSWATWETQQYGLGHLNQQLLKENSAVRSYMPFLLRRTNSWRLSKWDISSQWSLLPGWFDIWGGSYRNPV